MFTPMGRKNLVIVVDDEPSARCGLVRLLRAVGHDVRELASADEFLKALRSGTTGCVVLSAGLPGLSCEALRAALEPHGGHVPIIVVSADDDPESRCQAREMKAACFFRKPVDGPALVDAVDWALTSNRAGGKHDKG